MRVWIVVLNRLDRKDTGSTSALSKILQIFSLLLIAPLLGVAATRYALILDSPAVAEKVNSKAELRSVASQSRRASIRNSQQALSSELHSRRIAVTGSAQNVLNAVFVQASPDQEAELRALPGVTAVIPVRKYKPLLNRALQVANGPAGWAKVGGISNAGAGVKIAILDTGIDIGHSAFADEGYQTLTGYPRCSGFTPSGSVCGGYTNGKVIVARSYVGQLAAGDDGAADDVTPQDHHGHGTSTAAVAAGSPVTGPLEIGLNGMAPRAYLGVYRIFGTPGVNDFTSDDVIIQAFEDALDDDMDVVSFSVGGPAFTGPFDATCGPSRKDPCDLLTMALQRLTRQGLLVIASSGNEGADGLDINGDSIVTYGSLASPANLQSVLAVGAITNTHQFSSSILIGDQSSPTSQRYPAFFASATEPETPLTAPLKSVVQAGDDGLLCSPLPAGALSGKIALIARGKCNFADKAQYAEKAGAAGVIFYQAGSSPFTKLISVGSARLPAVIVIESDGQKLLRLAAGESPIVTLDPKVVENDDADGNSVAPFSSLGPSVAEGLAKPDMTAVGTTMLSPTQSFDPNGQLYSETGFTLVDGTSFSAPTVAGAAALVRQLKPDYTSAQVRSVLVNSASLNISPSTRSPRVTEVGAGKLNVKAALETNLVAEPTSVSFGILTPSSAFPLTKTFRLTNLGASASALTLSVEVLSAAGAAVVSVEPASVSLDAGASATITAKLSGSRPLPGQYDGTIRIFGGAVQMHVPYLFAVGDGQPYGIVGLSGVGFAGLISEKLVGTDLAFRVVDRYGIGVPGVPVYFTALNRRGRIAESDRETNQLGIARAVPVMPSSVGSVSILGSAGDLQFEFNGYAEATPVVASDGIVDAADFQSKPVAPGSLITIMGTDLSDVQDEAISDRLPMSLSWVTVSFYTANGSWPGKIRYVSPEQINVQVPWELEGQTSAQIRIGNYGAFSKRVNLRLASYAPSIFSYEDESGEQVAAAFGPNGNTIGMESAPASHGQTVLLLVSGLGAVKDRTNKKSETIGAPSITIGGVAAQVLSSNLMPECTGVYEVTAIVAGNTPAGSQDVVLSVGGHTSSSAKLHIE